MIMICFAIMFIVAVIAFAYCYNAHVLDTMLTSKLDDVTSILKETEWYIQDEVEGKDRNKHIIHIHAKIHDAMLILNASEKD